MSNPAEWLSKLETLRESVSGLESSGPDAEEFLNWRESLLKVTEGVFGLESSELAEAQALKFEPDPESMEGFRYQITDPDQPEQILGEMKRNDAKLLEAFRAVGDDPNPLEKSLRESHFKKTLWAAGELISAMIYVLKNRRG